MAAYPSYLDLGPLERARGSVRLPGSKSISNRTLLLAALAQGVTEIHDLLASDDVDRMLEALRFQLIVPVLGLPGLAVPTAPVNGMPMGVQIVSRRYREDLCLEAGEVVEAHAGPCTPIDPR